MATIPLPLAFGTGLAVGLIAMLVPPHGSVRATPILLMLVSACVPEAGSRDPPHFHFPADEPSSPPGAVAEPPVSPSPNPDPEPAPVPPQDADPTKPGPGEDPAPVGDPCEGADVRFAEVVAAFEGELARNAVPGGAIAIVCGGSTILAAGVGWAEEGGAVPISEGTLFQAASVTKSFTALTAIRLASQSVVALDASVSTYVPFVNTMAPHGRPFTLAELLSHSAGFPTDFPDGDFGSLDLETFFRNNSNQLLWSPPGEVFNYSNLGYALAGLALQRAAGRPFPELLEDAVFAPLQMADSRMDAVVVESGGDFATGHSGSMGEERIGPTDSYLASGYYGPMGGAWLSVRDFARFGRAILDPGTGPLGVGEVALFTTSRIRTSWPGVSYGLGTMIDTTASPAIVSHSGSVAGFLSSYELVPELGFGVFFLVNADWYFPTEAVSLAKDRFAQVELADPTAHVFRDSDWPEFVGRYEDPVSLGRVIVSEENGAAFASFPDLGFEAELTGLWRDTVSFDFSPWQMPLDGTFWRDGTGAVRWFVTSAGVAARQ